MLLLMTLILMHACDTPPNLEDPRTQLVRQCTRDFWVCYDACTDHDEDTFCALPVDADGVDACRDRRGLSTGSACSEPWDRCDVALKSLCHPIYEQCLGGE